MKHDEGRPGRGALQNNAAPSIAGADDGALLAVLRDARSRLARLIEALGDGELDLVVFIAEDLELDLARWAEGRRT